MSVSSSASHTSLIKKRSIVELFELHSLIDAFGLLQLWFLWFGLI